MSRYDSDLATPPEEEAKHWIITVAVITYHDVWIKDTLENAKQEAIEQVKDSLNNLDAVYKIEDYIEQTW